MEPHVDFLGFPVHVRAAILGAADRASLELARLGVRDARKVDALSDEAVWAICRGHLPEAPYTPPLRKSLARRALVRAVKIVRLAAERMTAVDGEDIDACLRWGLDALNPRPFAN